jgi:hypothetical protein
MDKGACVLGPHWRPGSPWGGWTRGRRWWILLGPFTLCVRAWRGEIARQKDIRLLDAVQCSPTRPLHLSRLVNQEALDTIAQYRLASSKASRKPIYRSGGSSSASSVSSRSAYRYLSGRLEMPFAFSNLFLGSHNTASDRAKSMLLASVGLKLVLEPPRRRCGRGWAVLTRPAISRLQATQDLGKTPTQAKAARRYG